MKQNSKRRGGQGRPKYTYRRLIHKPWFVRENQEGYHLRAVASFAPLCHLVIFLGPITTSSQDGKVCGSHQLRTVTTSPADSYSTSVCMLLLDARRWFLRVWHLYPLPLSSLISSQPITPSLRSQVNAFQMRC